MTRHPYTLALACFLLTLLSGVLMVTGDGFDRDPWRYTFAWLLFAFSIAGWLPLATDLIYRHDHEDEDDDGEGGWQ